MVFDYYITKKRLLTLFVLAIFVFIGIFCRLFYIQVVWGDSLQQKAQEQWQRDLSLEATRGNITDRNGDLLATTDSGFGIYVRPNSVTSAEKVASALSNYLDRNYDDVYSKITKKGVSEVTIATRIDTDVADKIRNENLDGVFVNSEGVRRYIYGDFLSQVLGYVNSDGDGQAGIESYYNKYLEGINGALLSESDLVGRKLESGESSVVAPTNGLTIVLTIDSVIQMIVENVLELAMYQQNPVGARAIVVDVTNGEILAMASKPSVDLNNLPRDDIQALMSYTKNVLITDVYEPGSTFKILTASACLEEYKKGNSKAFSADYVFRNNSRTRIIDGSKISCWSTHNNGKHSNQTLADALNNSCNPIFTDIALSLGKDVMYSYLEKFGYGKVTGLDYVGEQAGLLVSKNLVTNGDLARIGFGQTIAVTPLQLAMATSAAVNGGYLLQPHLVKEIIDEETNTVAVRFGTVVKNEVISNETSSQIVSMLENVVANGGGKNAYIEGYRVGGKTGTAQKYVDGKIAVGKYISSFVGFFPASSPKYLCLMIVDEPEGQSYGSIVAAPYARLIFEEIIRYKNIDRVC